MKRYELQVIELPITLIDILAVGGRGRDQSHASYCACLLRVPLAAIGNLFGVGRVKRPAPFTCYVFVKNELLLMTGHIRAVFLRGSRRYEPTPFLAKVLQTSRWTCCA
jgi:hypothetical protein